MITGHSIAQLPWSSNVLEDQRFRKLMAITIAIFLLFSIVIPMIPLQELKPPPLEELEKILIKWKRPELTPAQIKAREEAKRLAELEKKRLEEDALRKAEEERKRREKELAEKKKREKELSEKQKQELEAKRKREEELRKQREKERKRQAELDRQKRERDAKRQTEKEKKRRAEEAKKRREADARRVAEEKKRRAADERRRVAEEKRRVAAEKKKGEQLASTLFGDLNVADAPTAAAVSSADLVSGSQAQQSAPSNTSPSLITSGTGGGSKRSGGISSSQMAALNSRAGDGILEERSGTQVQEVDLGTIDDSGRSSQARSSSGGPTRSIRELNAMLEKYKGKIWRIYQKALRKDPSLNGKVVVKITILPDGSVQLVEIVSSDIDNDRMLRSLKTLIKGINFGAKNVPTVVGTYPIDFTE